MLSSRSQFATPGGTILTATFSTVPACPPLPSVPMIGNSQGTGYRKTAAVIVLLLVSVTVVFSASPTNIVLILADDLGWKDVGFTGSKFYRTPNIDRLAREGMQFTQAYSPACVCSPSRGAILTGKNPARTAFTTVFDGPGGPDD